ADARHEDAVGASEHRDGWIGQDRENRAAASGLTLPRAAAMHGDEARAEALEAGEILVAAGLVDRALAAELGFHGHDRQAIRLRRAIAAALADLLVDEDALGWIGIAVPLA